MILLLIVSMINDDNTMFGVTCKLSLVTYGIIRYLVTCELVIIIERYVIM